MTDSRPRPQYGEYATPEEQAKAIGSPAPTAPDRTAPDSSAPESTAPASPPVAMSVSASFPAPETRGAEDAVADPVRRLRRSRDIVFTVTLLGIGDHTTFTEEDYAHRCRNLSAQRPTLSLHVYGGVLERYRAYDRDTEGRWDSAPQRAELELANH